LKIQEGGNGSSPCLRAGVSAIILIMKNRIVYVSPVAEAISGVTYFCAEDKVQFFDGEFVRDIKLDEWEKETRDRYEEGDDDEQMICLEIMDAINYFRGVRDTERLRR